MLSQTTPKEVPTSFAILYPDHKSLSHKHKQSWRTGAASLYSSIFEKVHPRDSLLAQKVKRLPAIWETRVWSLGWKDHLEKKMATHSSILVWKIPWMEEPGRLMYSCLENPWTKENPGRLQSLGLQRVKYDWATSLSLSLFILGLWRWPEDHSNNCNNNNNKASIYWLQDIVLTHCHISQQSYEVVGSFSTLILQMKKIEAPRQ